MKRKQFSNQKAYDVDDTQHALLRDSDCVYVHEVKEIPPRYINVAWYVSAKRCSRVICWRRRCLARLLFWVDILQLSPNDEEEVARDREAVGRRSVRPDQLDDYAKFGKNAATHHFIEGPFFTVYQWFKIILQSRFLGERFNSIHSGRDWNRYSGELGLPILLRDSKIIDLITICI